MNGMNYFNWHFGIREGGSDTSDNIDAKFFTENYASLVRESLQNSLDAQSDETQPVVVIYRFGKMELPSSSQFYEVEKYIQGCLLLHPNRNDRVNKAYRPMLDYIQNAKKNGYVGFLEVTDSNTIGMNYDDDDERCLNTRFYSFAKSVGNSSKDNDTRGGSYGLGKAVFYKHSSMRTIIISTKTEDNAVAFEGIASLCTSKVDDKKREATGYFCDNDLEKPTTDATKIPEMFRRTASGTSIFIMGVDDSQDNQKYCYNEIKKAIASHFWLSILHKKLIVEVGNDRIDDSNIIEVASELFSTSNEDSPIPYIETVYYAENGEIDGYVKREENIPNLGKCLLYVHKDRKGSNMVLNMRKTEMLIFSQSMLKGYGYYGVFVCLGDEGNKILRMAEDPAHKQWSSRNCEDNEDKTAARRAIEAKNKAIKQFIIECFGGQNENTSTISDLQNYLYMTVSEQELESVKNAIYGIHSGEKQKEESAFKIPDLFSDNEPTEKANPSNPINVFFIEENISANRDDENGELEGGHEEGGGGGGGYVNPKHENKYSQEETGEEDGTFLKPIRLKACAVYTKTIDGILYHFLRIIPGCRCEKLLLDVYAIGDEEDSNDEIFIDNVFPGNLEGENRIVGLKANQDERLEIRVKFEDNMSHPVTIMAYEIA